MVSLESCRLFSGLPAARLAELRKGARELSFAAGQSVFKEGDPGDGVFVVGDGLVQISALIADQERREFSRVTPGDVFGEMSLLDNAPRSACATAEVDTTVYFIPRDLMVDLLRHSPELSMTLVQEISGRLREFNRQYMREILQAERMSVVGRFASSIIHDLKNPLTIISLAAESAGEEQASAAVRSTAQRRISQQVDRITHLVNDILEFTRGETHTLVFAETDYAELIAAIRRDFAPDLTLNGITLVCENEAPNIKLLLNPPRLTRVFSNLIANALDVLPDGGKILLRFRVDAEQVVTEIEDTGSGIAPEMMERLFEPFATFGKSQGTGLGLSICKRIIEEHRGMLTARNRSNGGAIFTFLLPRPKS